MLIANPRGHDHLDRQYGLADQLHRYHSATVTVQDVRA
jgi:hypothetical protein